MINIKMLHCSYLTQKNYLEAVTCKMLRALEGPPFPTLTLVVKNSYGIVYKHLKMLIFGHFGHFGAFPFNYLKCNIRDMD